MLAAGEIGSAHQLQDVRTTPVLISKPRQHASCREVRHLAASLRFDPLCYHSSRYLLPVLVLLVHVLAEIGAPFVVEYMPSVFSFRHTSSFSACRHQTAISIPLGSYLSWKAWEDPAKWMRCR